MTFIGLPATGFTLLMARETSRDQAFGDFTSSTNLLRRGNVRLVLAGAGLAAILVIVSPLLASTLKVPASLLIAAAIGVPFGLALPLLIGAFQGRQQFVTLSSLLVGQAGLKLVGALALGYVLGPLGIIAGISLASIATYVVALGLLTPRKMTKHVDEWWRPAAKYLAVIVPSTLALAVLLSADVLIVKRVFNDQAAGEYAAVAALGRAIFWGASGIAAVLFPKMVFRATQGHSGTQLVGASLGLVAIGGLAGFALLSWGSRLLLTAFAGGAYASAATYLPWYAVGMTFLGGVAVLIATHQTRGTPGFLAVLLPLTLLEPGALMLFHHDPMQVVQTLDICMAVILAGLGALYVLQERIRPNQLPALGVNR
jgi:O-antigen/teichoic acid export membrane protein